MIPPFFCAVRYGVCGPILIGFVRDSIRASRIVRRKHEINAKMR